MDGDNIKVEEIKEAVARERRAKLRVRERASYFSRIKLQPFLIGSHSNWNSILVRCTR